MNENNTNKTEQVANITTLGLVAKTSDDGKRNSLMLPTRTAWANARGMKPNAAETRRAYAAWAKETGMKAEAAFNASMKGQGNQFKGFRETSTTYTAIFAKAESLAAGTKSAKTSAEVEELKAQVAERDEQLRRLEAMVNALTAVKVASSVVQAGAAA